MMFANNAQVARDVAWIQTTSDILSQKQVFTVSSDFWSSLSFDSFPCYEGSHRIGFYYQWLIKQCLKQSIRYQLLAEELQVERERQTLGAIDFVVENACGEIEHWEVAIKFYLSVEGEWRGPNAKDTLAKKYHKMSSHQLMLSSTAEYRRQYPQFPITKRRLLLQGRLYINPFLSNAGMPTPQNLNTARMTGNWCWPHQLPEDKDFYVLGRNQWITSPCIETLPVFTLSDTLTRAVHLIDESNKRWFVVPESWPSC
ncbi:DUF1853 family protein [Grimontia hollisae]|nr:DUF1853 family protein [Grimontia hollisae]